MKKELDAKDVQILNLLLNNARLSNKEIAAKIGIAQSSTHDRIKKLTQKGYFKGTSVQIDQKKLGLNIEVMLAIRHASSCVDIVKPSVFTDVPDHQTGREFRQLGIFVAQRCNMCNLRNKVML